jgi:hypothetical protein
MNMCEADASAVQVILGCKIEGFPQTYFGLPLSYSKLRADAFNPPIAKYIKTYLGGVPCCCHLAAGSSSSIRAAAPGIRHVRHAPAACGDHSH